MDDHFVGGVHHKISKNKNQQTKRSGKNKKALKVVYISSPMKFNTCASNFRALVQELTGKDSDAAQYMESIEAEASPTCRTSSSVDDSVDDHVLGFPEHVLQVMNYDQESPTCTSDSAFDNGLVLPEGSFLDMFASSLLNESSIPT